MMMVLVDVMMMMVVVVVVVGDYGCGGVAGCEDVDNDGYVDGCDRDDSGGGCNDDGGDDDGGFGCHITLFFVKRQS